VNEGFARACSSPFRADLRRHQNSGKYEAQARC
jgi:hypothetical protein